MRTPSSSYFGFKCMLRVTPVCGGIFTLLSSNFCASHTLIQMLSTSCLGSDTSCWAAFLQWMPSYMETHLTKHRFPMPGHAFVEMFLLGLLYSVPGHLLLWTLLSLKYPVVGSASMWMPSLSPLGSVTLYLATLPCSVLPCLGVNTLCQAACPLKCPS